VAINYPTFSYNNPRIQGQTIFIKRGPHQADFGSEKVIFKRSDFLVHRYRKIRVPIDRVAGKNPDVL
jgi:hypothetical protein